MAEKLKLGNTGLPIDIKLSMEVPGYDRLIRMALDNGEYEAQLFAFRATYQLGLEAALDVAKGGE